MKRIISLIGFVICMLATLVQAQDVPKNNLQMLGRAQPDHVLLRWAPSTPMAWHYINQYGMKLERYTILRNGKVLDVPEKKVYTEIFKPLPLAEWEAISEKNEYALVAAQAIYGESFEVTENFSSDIAKALNKSKEMEQRHLFAMFAADQSKDVARASGLFYEDREVKMGEKYLYTISSLVPANVMKIDTGSVYLSLDNYFPLPAPKGLTAEMQESTVMLSWEGKRFQDFYNSFILEKSEDNGKTFKSVTDLPIVNPLKENGEYPDYIFKLDSVQVYNKKYVYRVKGINPFGETSPTSDTVSIVCVPKLKHTPHIIRTKVGRDGSILVQWTFPKEGRDSLQGFKLQRAGKIKGEVHVIKTAILPTDSVAVDAHPLNSNYYTIVAYDRHGNETSSMPSLAMLEDSIPPLAPLHVAGKIDSAGIVTLTWDKNKEKDLAGYRIYRSNFIDKEFEQVTVDPVKETVFTDTIEIKTLTKNMYYKAVAVDGHFNPSPFSIAVKLERPDVIPPAAPQVESIDTDDKGIHLKWINSVSDDVNQSILYRRASNEKGWMPIFKTMASDSVTTFLDSLSIPGELYAYTLVAIDFSGLESAPSKPVLRQRVVPTQQNSIKLVSGKADRKNNKIDLTWKYTEAGVVKYFIYRTDEKGNLVLYKEINGELDVFSDTDLKTNSVYKYRLQAQFANGALSPFSKEIVVNY